MDILLLNIKKENSKRGKTGERIVRRKEKDKVQRVYPRSDDNYHSMINKICAPYFMNGRICLDYIILSKIYLICGCFELLHCKGYLKYCIS